ncbi:hypothetical protein ACFU6R_32205 [Streptomyces sp. NPDC057499]|uniref:hypothetical protein n=1 Tax=Streptomyces sp. NPDC057499 TaxID=3346150 RepID=UPI00368B463E
MSPEQLAKMAARMKPVRRALLLVAEYQDPAWGALYAAYFGGDRATTAQAYGGLLYATGIQGELRIIASYREDIDTEPPPMHWQHSQGAEITLTGPPVAVRALLEPVARKAHLHDWKELRDSAGHR